MKKILAFLLLLSTIQVTAQDKPVIVNKPQRFLQWIQVNDSVRAAIIFIGNNDTAATQAYVRAHTGGEGGTPLAGLGISVDGFTVSIDTAGFRTLDSLYVLTDTTFLVHMNGGANYTYKLRGSVFSYAGRKGAVLPVESDYAAFYPKLDSVYSDPTWINSLSFTKVINLPQTMAGYHILDGVLNSGGGYSLGSGAYSDRPVGTFSNALYYATDTLAWYVFDGTNWIKGPSAGAGNGTILGSLTPGALPYAQTSNKLAGSPIINDTTNTRIKFNVPIFVNSTGASLLDKGTTAQRPGSPIAGHLRYNTDSSSYEQYTGAVWKSLASAAGGGIGLGTVTQVNTGYGITGGPITSSGTLLADTGKLIPWSDTLAYGPMVTRSFLATRGFLTTETDPVAVLKSVTLTGTANRGIVVGGTGTQSLGSNPTFSLVADTTYLATLSSLTRQNFVFGPGTAGQVPYWQTNGKLGSMPIINDTANTLIRFTAPIFFPPNGSQSDISSLVGSTKTHGYEISGTARADATFNPLFVSITGPGGLMSYQGNLTAGSYSGLLLESAGGGDAYIKFRSTASANNGFVIGERMLSSQNRLVIGWAGGNSFGTPLYAMQFDSLGRTYFSTTPRTSTINDPYLTFGTNGEVKSVPVATAIYDSVALIDARAAIVGGYIWINGVHFPGDGGEGPFYWNAASTATPIQGMVLAIPGISTGRLFRNYTGMVHTRWMGILPDTAADQSTAIALAINMYAKIKNGLKIDSGVYCIKNMTISNANWLYIDGYGATFKTHATATFGTPVLKVTTSKNITIVGLSHDGNKQMVAGSEFGGSVLTQYELDSSITVRDCKLFNNGYGGQNFYNSYNIRVLNCDIDSVDIGTQFLGGNNKMLVDGCRYYKGTSEAVVGWGLSAVTPIRDYDLTVTNCTVKYKPGGYEMRFITGFRIIGNHAVGCNQAFMGNNFNSAGAYISLRDNAANGVIEGNTFDSCVASAFTGPLTNVKIVNNIVTNTQGYGARIGGNDSSYQVVVSGNIFNEWSTSNPDSAGGAIYIKRCNNCEISGNVMLSKTINQCINVDSSNQIRIFNNTDSTLSPFNMTLTNSKNVTLSNNTGKIRPLAGKGNIAVHMDNNFDTASVAYNPAYRPVVYDSVTGNYHFLSNWDSVGGGIKRIGTVDSLPRTANVLQMFGNGLFGQTANASFPGYEPISHFKEVDSLIQRLLKSTISLGHPGAGVWSLYSNSDGSTLFGKNIQQGTGILVATQTDSSIKISADFSTVVGLTNTQTLTNKTLTSPTINSGNLVTPDITGLSASTDTTTNKPLGVDGSGNTVRMSYWPGSGSGGGGSQNLSQSLSAFADTIKISGGTGYTFGAADHTHFGGITAATSAKLDSNIVLINGKGHAVARAPYTQDSLILAGINVTGSGGIGVAFTGAKDSLAWNITFNTLTTAGDLLYYNSGNARLAAGSIGQALVIQSNGLPGYSTLTGTGSVTKDSVGNLSPLFSANTTNPTTTPVTSFTQTPACAHCYLGNPNGTSGAYSFQILNLTGGDFAGQGTVNTVPHGNAAGNMSFGPVRLDVDVTGLLQATQFPALVGPVQTTAGTLTTTIANGALSSAMIASLDASAKLTNQVPGANGGTGVNNAGKTITLGGNLTLSGAFATTLTVTAATNATLPAGTTTLLNTTGSGAGLSNIVQTMTDVANQVTWTHSGTNWTAHGPQDLGTVSSPIFTGLSVTGLGAGSSSDNLVTVNGSGVFRFVSLATMGASSGVYTPTITANVNCTGGTATLTQYIRVGNEVSMSGHVLLTPTTLNSNTSFYLSLPFVSTFSNFDANGTITIPGSSTATSTIGQATADISQNQILISYINLNNTSNNNISFSLHYTIH